MWTLNQSNEMIPRPSLANLLAFKGIPLDVSARLTNLYFQLNPSNYALPSIRKSTYSGTSHGHILFSANYTFKVTFSIGAFRRD